MSKNEPLSLEVFDNPEFGQMRILREGDKYLFCASDAATALGYSNPRAALQRHCKGVAKRDTLTCCGYFPSFISSGGNQSLFLTQNCLKIQSSLSQNQTLDSVYASADGGWDKE